jgi:CubicO group peptidase (beta-lactamase class C family)
MVGRRTRLAWALFALLVTAPMAACSTATLTPTPTAPSGSSDVVATTPVAPPLLPAASTDPFTPEIVADLLDATEGWISPNNGPGVTAAVVSAKGTWSGAGGVDGTGRPLVPNAMMGIGSITKTFVAAEVMALSGRGLIDLDTALTNYIPLSFSDGGATVRQVLGMMSGFPEIDLDRLSEQTLTEPARAWTTAELLQQVDPKGLRIGSLGVAYGYNNLNYILLGQLIEKVTGKPLATALREDLLRAADFNRVVVQDAEAPPPPLARPVPDLHGLPPLSDGAFLPSRAIAGVFNAAGGMAADAPSIARWTYLLYGGYVISPSLVGEMATAGPDIHYGLGTELGDFDGLKIIGHAGSVPGYYGLAFVWPQRAVAITVLVPQNPPEAVIPDMTLGQLMFKLRGIVSPDPPKSTTTT